MAYETGVASTPTDLVNKLVTFAVANGWTSHSPLSGKVISKGNVVCGLFGQASTLDTRGAITALNGVAWNAQTGNSGTTHQCNIGAGPYTAYHFYSLSEESKELLAAVIEIAAGVYRHWMLCDLIKAGSWTGGTYTDSVNWDTSSDDINVPESNEHQVIADSLHVNSPQTGHYWVDSDSGVNSWGRVADADSFTLRNGVGSVRGQGKNAYGYAIGYQRWNLRTPLWPIELFVNRNSSLRSPLGRVPAMRHLNMRNHTPGEILTIGGDDFQLWPICARTETWDDTSSTVYSSGYHGYAYKRT